MVEPAQQCGADDADDVNQFRLSEREHELDDGAAMSAVEVQTLATHDAVQNTHSTVQDIQDDMRQLKGQVAGMAATLKQKEEAKDTGDAASAEARESEGEEAVQDGEPITLFNIAMDMFLSQPVRKKSWPNARLGGVACPHTVRRVDGAGALQDGDIVRLETSRTTDENYVMLYGSKAGNVYYDLQRDSGGDMCKQTWRVRKTSHPHNSSGRDILHSDLVVFECQNWEGSYLCYDNGVGCMYTPEKQVWRIE